MAKEARSVFYCQECGYESAKWLGQCPACKAWNTMVEEPAKRTLREHVRGASGKNSGSGAGLMVKRGAAPKSLREIEASPEKRVVTGIGELDRVLGGGIVPGSLILIGGDPGIGKSTLLLQVCTRLAAQGRKVLYVSGEESLRQIALRAERIGGAPDALRFLCETDLGEVTGAVLEEQPELVIVDSIQTMYSEEVSSAPGSVSQVREITGILLRLAKEQGISFFIVGHMTKDGTVAGPRVLEHMVDTVLYFEGDQNEAYRVLRGSKNRFGSTNEIGLFEMRGDGLKEVLNASEYMIDGRPKGASGSVVSCAIEGTRPLLIEIQALLAPTSFGFPKRQATGTDLNRVSLLMAVLEKRLGVALATQDAYINLAGGMRQSEPALDLGIALAVLSSYRNAPLDDDLVAFGEVGLSGEVRGVQMAERRVTEAAKLGFTKIMLPARNAKDIKAPEGILLIPVHTVADAAEKIREMA